MIYAVKEQLVLFANLAIWQEKSGEKNGMWVELIIVQDALRHLTNG